LFEWHKCKAADVITLDGSNSYDLSRLLSNPFQAEIDLMDESGRTYYKVDYNWYLKSTDKAYLYAILGETMYVTGDTGDLNFVYLTPGKPYPLKKDGDENLITKYYHDIIKIMTAIQVYDYIGDNEQVQREEAVMARKVITLKKHENRTRQSGKLHFVSRKGNGG
jgi:hypothetical protein